MINRYYDFILESRIQLLMEGKLVVSKDFKNTLKKMNSIVSGEDESDEPIHSLLLDFIKDEEEIEEPLSQNYLDIVQDKDDTITFMSDKNFDRLENPPEKKKEIFLLKGRSEIKIGRFIRAFLTASGNDYYTAKAIEEFVNLWKSVRSGKDIEFRIVEGSDIPKYYQSKNYISGESGMLGDSCMNDQNEGIFEIYSKNPSVCKLVILEAPGGKILGRALAWKPSKLTDAYPEDFSPEWILDRPYTTKDSDVNKFKDFANQNGWAYRYKLSNDYDESRYKFVWRGSKYVSKIEVKLESGGNFRLYPYVDTMKFYDGIDNLSNHGFPRRCFSLNDTGGGYDSWDEYEDNDSWENTNP